MRTVARIKIGQKVLLAQPDWDLVVEAFLLWFVQLTLRHSVRVHAGSIDGLVEGFIDTLEYIEMEVWLSAALLSNWKA